MKVDQAEDFRRIFSKLVCLAMYLLTTGRTAIFIRDRANLLNLRIRALRSKQCAVKDNNYVCPEVFLDAVADKLSSMAVLFLNVELLSEFYYQVLVPC